MMKTVRDETGRYDICEDGSIINRNSGNRLSPFPDNEGYLKVNLYLGNSKSKCVYVHRLVAESFVAKPEASEPLAVYHKDGNKQNNAASNLAWKPFKKIISDYHKQDLYKDHLQSLRRKIVMINPRDNFAKTEFGSLIEAAVYLKSINPDSLPDVLMIRSNISNALNKVKGVAYGCYWEDLKD